MYPTSFGIDNDSYWNIFTAPYRWSRYVSDYSSGHSGKSRKIKGTKIKATKHYADGRQKKGKKS